MHGAVLRVTFASNVEAHEPKRVCFREADFNEGPTDSGGYPTIEGQTFRVSSDKIKVRGFAMHIVAEARGVGESKNAKITIETMGRTFACFTSSDTSPASGMVMEVKIATSLISKDQARLSLSREMPPSDTFTETAATAKSIWNELLGRVNVVDSGELTERSTRYLSVFYTGLARALAFPRRLDEVDKNGKVVHYSPYSPDGGVYDGILVTDNGFWDTFRTVYPMLSLLYPDHLGNIVQGWLNSFKEGGWLPSWASPGYRNCMVGTFADVVVADAIVKNVPGFDLDLAARALEKDAFTDPPQTSAGAVGKEGLTRYKSLGFLPNDPGGHDVVSRTLDYGFSDFATGEAYSKMSKEGKGLSVKDLSGKASQLSARAIKAHNALFSRDFGLMVPKDSSGRLGHINALAWGNGYTEGNAWHHSFPPYALTELSRLHGSPAKLADKIRAMLKMPSNFNPGSYGNEIHEMTEARAFAMGQYMHNNQPVHHILYIFAMLGFPKETASNVRQVLDRGYGLDFYAGDEDNGEQGAWFVLSSLGLFSLVPGTTDYVLGTPLFKHVTIARAPIESLNTAASLYTKDFKSIGTGVPSKLNERSLHIIAKGTSETGISWDGIILDDKVVDGVTVSDIDLQNSASVLRFVMEGEDWAKNKPESFIESKSIVLARAAKSGHIEDGVVSTADQGNSVVAAVASASASLAATKDLADIEIAKLKEQHQQREADLKMEAQHNLGMAESLQHRIDILEQQLRIHPNHPSLVGGASNTAQGGGGNSNGGGGGGGDGDGNNNNNNNIGRESNRKFIDTNTNGFFLFEIFVGFSLMTIVIFGFFVGAGWSFCQNISKCFTFNVPAILPLSSKNSAHTV